MIDISKLTRSEIKQAISAIDATTYLMQYCAVNKYGNNCAKCILNTADGCAAQGAPYEYKPIRNKKEAGQ